MCAQDKMDSSSEMSAKADAETTRSDDFYESFMFFLFFFFFEFIDLNKQAVIYKAKALKQIQINSKGQP